jgi:hypothetical protein
MGDRTGEGGALTLFQRRKHRHITTLAANQSRPPLRLGRQTSFLTLSRTIIYGRIGANEKLDNCVVFR